jgi:hypothetical protein
MNSLLLFFPFICYAQNSIEGVWSIEQYPNKNSSLEYELSWGKRVVPRSFDIIVDLHSETPKIIINQFSMDDIISLTEKDDKIELTFYFRRGDFNITMFCHFNEEGTMWIEPLPDGLTFFRTGENQIYYKIDDPKR